MKKHLFLNSILISSIAISLAIILGYAQQKSFYQIDAISLPTTINLNDSTEAEIRNYYSSLNSLESNEKKGENLLKNLKSILVNNPSNPSKPARYFSFSQDRRIAKITDRNWKHSPASELAGYNSTKNTILNYPYSDDNPYIYLYYRSDNDSNPHRFDAKQTSTESTSMTMLNQEHLWSVSHGFDNKTTGASARETPNAGTDLHHLVSSDAAVNQWGHSNYSYGMVSEDSSDWAKAKTKWDNGDNAILGNKRGISAENYSVDEGTAVVFEPQDSDKGDIARALLYMAARYNYIGTEIAYRNASVSEPDLTLVNRIINGTRSSSPSSEPVEYGCLDTLLKWHKEDPVDEFEIHRNNLIYNNFQYTRNPFIDFPSWVDSIWGNVETEVNPTTDLINVYKQEEVKATKIEFTKSSHTIKVNEEYTPTVTFTPSNVSSKTLTWSSLNSSIASVNSEGKIKGISQGTTTVTAKTTDGSNLEASIQISVAENVVEKIEIVSNPKKTTYIVGEVFTTEGIKVEAIYSDNSRIDITSRITISTPSTEKEGEFEVKVVDPVSQKETTFKIKVQTKTSALISKYLPFIIAGIALIVLVIIVILIISKKSKSRKKKKKSLNKTSSSKRRK